MNEMLELIYENYFATLKKEEVTSYIEAFKKHSISIESVTLQNGDIELRMTDLEGDTTSIYLNKVGNQYIIHQTLKLKDSSLGLALRETIPIFTIETSVVHIYEGFDMIYHYKRGIINKIFEKNTFGEKIIYDYKGMNACTEKVQDEEYMNNIKNEIDILLDQRNKERTVQDIKNIDQELSILTYRIKKTTFL